MPYSRVCGRINALQKGIPDAFSPGFHNPSLEGVYVDGISLTHGAVGSRQHIWTFAAAASETGDPLYTGHAVHALCPCMNTNWPYQIPSFVGNNYFCDTGNPGENGRLFADDPMWDGEGCGAYNNCCQFNAPPWFCTTLPQPTADDIEIRLCGNEHLSDEDYYTQLVDIYVM